MFWDDALRALGLDAAPELERLVSRQFVLPRAASQLEGRREYAFRHHLLHRVCYERLLQRDRVPAHACVARWLQGLPGDKPQDQVAEHYERGAEPALALAAWQQAAEQAQARYANEQALLQAARGLALTTPDALALRYQLTLLRTQVHALIGDTAARVAGPDALTLLAESLDDNARRCEVLAARAGRYVANALQLLGRHDEFERSAQHVLVLARRMQDKGTEGAMLNALGLHADDRGDPAAAIACYEQALHCHRATGNQSHEADALSNLGYVEMGLGAYEQAAARFEAVLARDRRIGQREREASALLNLALAALHSGQPAHALALACQALTTLQAVGSRWLASAAQRIAGQASLAMGEGQQAVERLQAACEQFQSLGLTQGLGLEGTEEPLRVHADCWQVLQALHDPRAPLCLQQGRRLLAERAARAADAGRRDSFIHRVPHHRLLWQAGEAA